MLGGVGGFKVCVKVVSAPACMEVMGRQYQVITEQGDPEFFPPLLISRILAFPCTVCVDRTWKRRRIVLKSCHPSCKLNTHCRIHGHFGTMKMTGTKTGRRINERSLTLIRLKIFGGRIKFIFFVVLYHSCLRYRIIITSIIIVICWLFRLVFFIFAYVCHKYIL